VAGEEGQRWGLLLEEEWPGVAAFGEVHDGTGRQGPGERLLSLVGDVPAGSGGHRTRRIGAAGIGS